MMSSYDTTLVENASPPKRPTKSMQSTTTTTDKPLKGACVFCLFFVLSLQS